MHKRRSRSELPHQSDATSSKMCQKCANSHSLESQQVPIENNTWNEREWERERENFIQFYSFDIIVMAQTFMRGCCFLMAFVGFAYYQEGKDIIVFRFIIEYSSLRDFYRPLGNINNRSIYFYMRIFERWYILACVESWDQLQSCNILKDFGFF